jgi:hypothetical protein
MRGKWSCHEITCAADIADPYACVDSGLLPEPLAGAGVKAPVVGGTVFSFLLCEFFADHRVHRSGGRDSGAGLSALIINVFRPDFDLTKFPLLNILTTKLLSLVLTK